MKNSVESTDERLTLGEYQVAVRQSDQNKEQGLDGLAFFLLGLFGEVGTLLSALKKKQRDRESFVGYTEAIYEEFGDVLWYFSSIASRASQPLTVLAQRVSRGLHDWDDVQNDSLGTFSDLQSEKAIGGSAISAEFESAVIALAGKVGLLLNDFHLGKYDANRDILAGNLVDVFRAVIDAASIANIDLDVAAKKNIEKVCSRWPSDRVFTPLFDSQFDELERLPRRIVMHIFERRRGNKAHVIQQCNGINIGSAVTDNRTVVDDYRFHDVFHLAYAAILGWSPVLRALFKLKRKSVPAIDEAQDGARAILIEEGISTLIFHRAMRLKLFEGIESLDYSLLKLIPEFVAGYEVEACDLWQWEKAILDGYSVFRKIRIHRRGIVTADLNNRSITFAEMT